MYTVSFWKHYMPTNDPFPSLWDLTYYNWHLILRMLESLAELFLHFGVHVRASLLKMSVSYANCKWLMSMLLHPTSIVYHIPTCTARIIILFSTSAISMNRKGDSGSPCLIPLSIQNGLVGAPLNNIDTIEVVRKALIHFFHFSANAIICKTRSRLSEFTVS